MSLRDYAAAAAILLSTYAVIVAFAVVLTGVATYLKGAS